MIRGEVVLDSDVVVIMLSITIAVVDSIDKV
jgi:hypothetical protein